MSFATWKKRIEQYQQGAPIQESYIVALRKALRSTSLDNEIYGMLMHEASYRSGLARWAISQAQTDKGYRWITGQKVYRRFTEEQRRIIDHFDHFLFVGVTEHAGPVPLGLYRSYRPVYRVCTADGDWFDYSATAWQEGGVLQVMGQKGGVR